MFESAKRVYTPSFKSVNADFRIEYEIFMQSLPSKYCDYLENKVNSNIQEIEGLKSAAEVELKKIARVLFNQIDLNLISSLKNGRKLLNQFERLDNLNCDSLINFIRSTLIYKPKIKNSFSSKYLGKNIKFGGWCIDLDKLRQEVLEYKAFEQKQKELNRNKFILPEYAYQRLVDSRDTFTKSKSREVVIKLIPQLKRDIKLVTASLDNWKLSLDAQSSKKASSADKIKRGAIVLDLNMATLSINGEINDVNIGTQSIKFLELLMKEFGVVSKKKIIEYISFGNDDEEYDDKTNLSFVRGNLKKDLKKSGFRQEEIDYLMGSIQAQSTIGYIFKET
jgi:hypothetical protein